MKRIGARNVWSQAFRLSSGFQMVELLISVTIFVLVVGLCFYAASAGFRIFAHTTSRQSLQRDSRAIFTWLQRDVGLSNLIRCHSVQRDNLGDRRDALAVAAMDSWQQPIATDSLGLPRWDQLVVYVATREPQGRLLRQEFTPTIIPLQPSNVVSMLGSAIGGTLNSEDQRRLSGSVKSFSVELSEARNRAVFDLILTEITVDAGGGRPRVESLQVQTTIFPRNTWPRL